jgi:hypothetical protein
LLKTLGLRSTELPDFANKDVFFASIHRWLPFGDCGIPLTILSVPRRFCSYRPAQYVKTLPVSRGLGLCIAFSCSEVQQDRQCTLRRVREKIVDVKKIRDYYIFWVRVQLTKCMRVLYCHLWPVCTIYFHVI